MTEVKIHIGECVTVMKQRFDSESIDVIVTSPPYFQQREYGKNEASDEIGTEETCDGYIQKLREWAIECRRILKNSGSLFLNIGDKYSKKGLMMVPEKVCIMMIENGWVLRNKIVWYKPNHMPSSVKDRFCGSWEPVYFFVKDSGKYFNYPYHCDLDKLREKTVTESKLPFPKTCSVEEYEGLALQIAEYNEKHKRGGKFKNTERVNMGASPGARGKDGVHYSRMRKHSLTEEQELEIHGYFKDSLKESKKTAKSIDEVFGYKSKAGHWFRLDPGRSMPSKDDYVRLKDIIGLDDRYDTVLTEEHYVLQSVTNNPNGKTPEDMWTISLEHRPGVEHYAVYPVELPKRIIRAFCPEGGVVLDPFGGSGTTGVACLELEEDRVCHLIELNPEFEQVILKRLESSAGSEEE
jgi:DNA modification methylase